VPTPLPSSNHDTTEFEFHISPAPNSSRPQVGLGTRATRSSRCSAGPRSQLSRRGLSTASATSGMTPSRHRRISYRKSRKRPAQRAPTGPSPTTPRCAPLPSGIGVISITKRPAGTQTTSAEWYRSRVGRRSRAATNDSKMRPFHRTERPPAPRGNQYKSTLATAAGESGDSLGRPVMWAANRAQPRVDRSEGPEQAGPMPLRSQRATDKAGGPTKVVDDEWQPSM